VPHFGDREIVLTENVPSFERPLSKWEQTPLQQVNFGLPIALLVRSSMKLGLFRHDYALHEQTAAFEALLFGASFTTGR